jgi:regulation of enolase protein 1 (concanavalin A-like superfamily)
MIVPGIPFALDADIDADIDIDIDIDITDAWVLGHDPDTLSVVALPHSDIFLDPGEGSQVNAESLMNARTLLGAALEGDFQLRARVRVDFTATFDAGVLLLWFDRQHWAKLCFELAPDRQPMVVSVVTRGAADDANAFDVDGGQVWLRISRISNVFAFHASTDGNRWRMVRVFPLDPPGAALRVGFEAQSPTGEGCAVHFDAIEFSPTSLNDLRDGS